MKLLLSTGGWIGIAVAAAVVIILVIWFIASYNSLINLRTHTDDAYSRIDISLKKRYDLIPNVVETVKGYAKHESETLTKVTEARAQLGNATTREELAYADNAMSQAVRGLTLLVEKYPDLKANTNFMNLQNQLTAIENELSQARSYYNANVRELNKKIKTFPTLIVAKAIKMKPETYFQIEDSVERQNVKVQF